MKYVELRGKSIYNGGIVMDRGHLLLYGQSDQKGYDGFKMRVRWNYSYTKLCTICLKERKKHKILFSEKQETPEFQQTRTNKHIEYVHKSISVMVCPDTPLSRL